MCPHSESLTFGLFKDSEVKNIYEYIHTYLWEQRRHITTHKTVKPFCNRIKPRSVKQGSQAVKMSLWETLKISLRVSLVYLRILFPFPILLVYPLCVFNDTAWITYSVRASPPRQPVCFCSSTEVFEDYAACSRVPQPVLMKLEIVFLTHRSRKYCQIWPAG